VAFEPIRGAHGATNPHIWLDPDIMRRAAPALAERLSRLRPGQRQRFAAGAAAFSRAVAEADRQSAELLRDLAPRRVVTFHPGFDYFFRHYGLEVAGTYLDLAGSEPGPRRIAELLATIREDRIPALFREPQLPAGPARALAGEAGIRLAMLDPLGFSADIRDYPGLLLFNARQVRHAYAP